jgi:hypothetical protein
MAQKGAAQALSSFCVPNIIYSFLYLSQSNLAVNILTAWRDCAVPKDIQLFKWFMAKCLFRK